MYCWGDNRSGQLGDGSLQSSSVPIQVSLSNANDIALGTTHTCAIKRGQVYCWGRNDPYQHLGWQGAGRQRTPRLNAINGVFSLSASAQFTCGASTQINNLGGLDGVVCWGRNDTNNLGTGSPSEAGSAVRVGSLQNARRIAVGDGHGCAVRRSGTVHCWGDNTQGQLGAGNDNDTNDLMQAGQLTDVIEISAGRDHTCARDIDGSIYCWGDNEHGTLGLGGNDRPSPTRIQTF